MTASVLDNYTTSSSASPLHIIPSVSTRTPTHSATLAASCLSCDQAPIQTMHHFVPRPFPPPALANVPVEYIVNQLHSYAPHYWSKPETADCTIVVPLSTYPVVRIEQASRSSSATPELFPTALPELRETSRSERRKTVPAQQPTPRMVIKLHMDYLSAHSTLLRSLFSGISPLDLRSQSPSSLSRGPSFVDTHLQAAAASRNASQLSLNSDPVMLKSHAPLIPRLLPSSPEHPVLYLPVPDPSSFRLLVHYMYFGSTTFMEDALDRGTISWEGLARNVEYLAMGTDVKLFLGRWYSEWRRGQDDLMYDEDDDDMDSDVSYDSSDDEEAEIQSSATSLSRFGDKMDLDDMDSLEEMDRELSRGRTRNTRRLCHASSDPMLQASIAPNRFQSFALPRTQSH